MSDDLATLDATAQAELVRRREVSPRELVDAAIARLRAARTRSSTPSSMPALEQARARAAAPDLPRRPVPRRALPDEGPRRRRGRPPLLRRHALPAKTPAGPSPPTPTSPTSCSPPAWSSSAAPTRPSSACCRPPSPTPSAPTRNPWNARRTAPAARAAARRRRSRPASCRPRTPATAAARSASRPSMCGLVGLKPTRGRNSFGPGARRALERLLGRVRRHPLGARRRGAARRHRRRRCPAIPTPRAPPARPFADGVGDAAAAPLRIGLLRGAPRDAASSCTPSAAPPSTRAARLLADLGHAVEESHPAALDEPAARAALTSASSPPTSPARSTRGRRSSVARSSADDVEPLTWARRRARPRRPGHRAARHHRVRARLRPPPGRVVGERLRPAGHADHGAPPPRASATCRSTRRGAAARLHALRALRRLHVCRSTCPASRRSRCRCTGRADGLPVGVQLVAAYRRARTCCCRSPRSSKRPRPGRDAGRRCTPERITPAAASQQQRPAPRQVPLPHLATRGKTRGRIGGARLLGLQLRQPATVFAHQVAELRAPLLGSICGRPPPVRRRQARPCRPWRAARSRDAAALAAVSSASVVFASTAPSRRSSACRSSRSRWPDACSRASSPSRASTASSRLSRASSRPGGAAPRLVRTGAGRKSPTKTNGRRAAVRCLHDQLHGAGSAGGQPGSPRVRRDARRAPPPRAGRRAPPTRCRPRSPRPRRRDAAPPTSALSVVSGSRAMRTGELVRVSTPISWPSAPAKPGSVRSNVRAAPRAGDRSCPAGSSAPRSQATSPGR